ncbi:MAG: LacI family transcriptional regulator [Lachnospiraceae bacterium]|nr:LacI family transcriptional regulator [Lachnospiraceae bacterium]
MAATIRDVAQEAGVSTSTVSKVLNNWSSISPETCARVRAAIDKLQYTPNARAVSFARGATRNIIFLSSLKKEEAYHNPHMFDILCGVQKELSSQGYTLMLTDILGDSSPETFLTNLITSRIADGILIHGSCNIPGMVKIMTETQFPHIYIGNPGRRSRICWIDTNNGLAGQFAAQHMIECHYDRVAFLAESRTDYISMQRLNGFLGGMYDYGYRIPDEYIRYTDSTREDAYRQSMELLALPEPPQAIVCENNTLALSLSKALQDKHVRIPDEVAFLTFDSYPYSALIEPSPTIIDIDVYDLGVQAAVMLLRKLENPSLLVQTYTTLPVLRQGCTTSLPLP